MIAEQYIGLINRTDEDKLQLIEELLLDVMGDCSEDNPSHAALMETRLAEYRSNPDQVSPWADVKKRLLALRK
jgi:hypothetical protein